jgi:hypothetical protein
MTAAAPVGSLLILAFLLVSNPGPGVGAVRWATPGAISRGKRHAAWGEALTDVLATLSPPDRQRLIEPVPVLRAPSLLPGRCLYR